MTCPTCSTTTAIKGNSRSENGQPTQVELECGHTALMNPFFGVDGDKRRVVAPDTDEVLAYFAAMRDVAGNHPGEGDIGRAASVRYVAPEPEPYVDIEDEAEESAGNVEVWTPDPTPEAKPVTETPHKHKRA